MSTTIAMAPRPGALRRLWDRELPHYPGNAKRYFNLGLVVVVTIMMYYQYFLTAAVSGHVLREFGISFLLWVNLSVLGNVLGALASLAGGLTDKYGRANTIVVCVFLIAGFGLFGIPHAHSGTQFLTMNILVGIVEGVALVAAPALIRDFSPQIGRGAAMGFWAIGPVAASLLVALVTSTLSDTTPWQDHFIISGVAGLTVGVVALLALRELSPALRDQLMVSAHDRALVEARAKGIDVEASLRHPFRQVLKRDIVSSAVGIGLFMIMNFILLAFLSIMFQTAFGYTQARANSLGNWAWAADGVTLILAGFVSDKLRVRKPFMLVAAVCGAALTTAFALHLTQPHTGYLTFALLLAGIGACLGLAFGTWMAAFTETVEKHNPALAATGLSVWGMIFRIIGATVIFIGPHVVGAVTTVAQHGPTVKALATGTAPNLTASQNAAVKTIAADPTIVVNVKTAATHYAPQLATAAKIDPATAATLRANPTNKTAQATAVADIATAFHITPAQAVDRLAALSKVPTADKQLLTTWGPVLKDPKVQASLLYLKDHGPALKAAAAAAPHQWQHLVWIAVGGQILFIPLIFVMAGGWNPRRARRTAEQHEAWLQTQLANTTKTPQPALA